MKIGDTIQPTWQYEWGSVVNGETHMASSKPGTVVKIIPGYPAHRHRETGEWIPEDPPAPVVEYTCRCGAVKLRRCVIRDDEENDS